MFFDPKVVPESGAGGSQPLSSWGAAGLTIAVAIAYFLAARLSLALLTKPDGVAVFWPAAGISAGVLIALGRTARLPIVGGVAIATIVANLLGDRNLWSAIVFAVCNAGEAVIVAGLIHRFLGSPFTLDRLHRVLGLMVAAIVGTVISGIGGAVGFKLFHASSASALTIWLHWFTADAIGIVTVAPLVIGLFSARHNLPPARERTEGALGLVAIALLSGLAISLPHQMWAVEIALVLLVPILVWIGARCSPIFSAVAAFIVAFVIVCATTFGIGVFGAADLSAAERALAAQSAIVVVAFCALVLAALFAERRQHIQALVERQQQLENALKVAERADHAKSIFLAAASHDLRQPLQTLNLLQATLMHHARDVETHALVTEMGHAVDVMNAMLISLLDINRLESGTLSPSTTDFPVNELFDSALRDFLQPIADKGLELRVVRSCISVRSDRRILEEIIRNILSNAVRYTEQGRILVGCRRAGDKLRIEIWDSGVGIMGEHLPHIFEEYYQAPDKAQYGGFGLGLAIVQRLGTVLGHRIDVRSTPGKGSGFFVEVPLGTQVEARPDPDVAYEIVTLPRAILVIEDDSSVRTSLDSLLRSAGAQVISVATAHDALTQLTEKGVRPDVVVSDYNLPGKMNGVEAVKALRKILGWEIPAIVLTGDTRKEIAEELARCNVGVAFKPIDGDRLLRLIMAFHNAE
jgi:signal transduction histidine kinase/CheY-like chemotaxis protein